MKLRKNNRGMTMIETALALPLLMGLFLASTDMMRAGLAWTALKSAADQAAVWASGQTGTGARPSAAAIEDKARALAAAKGLTGADFQVGISGFGGVSDFDYLAPAQGTAPAADLEAVESAWDTGKAGDRVLVTGSLNFADGFVNIFLGPRRSFKLSARGVGVLS